jgi:hypothetical protein
VASEKLGFLTDIFRLETWKQMLFVLHTLHRGSSCVSILVFVFLYFFLTILVSIQENV